jgi:hypothetical protein
MVRPESGHVGAAGTVVVDSGTVVAVALWVVEVAGRDTADETLETLEFFTSELHAVRPTTPKTTVSALR